MAKKIAVAVLALLAVVGTLGGIKGLQIAALVAHARSFAPPPESVAVAPVAADAWQPAVTAVGSVTAVEGATLGAEVPGIVRKIAFASGALARRGQVLIELDSSAERAELLAAQAQAQLAQANLERTRQLIKVGARAQADLDAAQAQAKQTTAQVASLDAALAKRTVRAPFSGRLGIRQVSLGQFVTNGAPLVSLQSFDPIHVDFALPQQWLARLAVGQSVEISVDAWKSERFAGTLTAIDPDVDVSTRNVGLQATLGNPDGRLRPGMFVEASVVFPEKKRVLVISATAVVHAPYGDSVFVVERKKTRAGKAQEVVRQQFVQLGETRGDLVAVSSGLAAGQRVVTSGAFKLRPGMVVQVQSGHGPDAQLAPKPKDT